MGSITMKLKTGAREFGHLRAGCRFVPVNVIREGKSLNRKNFDSSAL
jgi:hypothetical protein